MLNGFRGAIEITGKLQGASKSVVRVSRLRRESDGFASLASGSLQVVGLSKGTRKIDVSFGPGRLEPDGGFELT